MATYRALLTTAGAAKIAAATAGGTQVNITRMAVGDGGGKLPTPDPKQTKLANEVYRANLNRLSIDVKNSNYLVAELVIQPDVGGFWMREMGLYDADGVLVAVSNMADSYKPQLAEGSGRLQTLRMVLIVSEIESIALSIDGSTVMATKDYVDDKLSEHEKSRNHPDGTLTAKGFVQLNSSVSSTSETLAATPKAVKAANDNANGRLPSGGTAVAATKLATARKIAGAAFDGTADITISPENVGALPSDGTAVAANKLATARKIAGVAFDGTADINIPPENVGALPAGGTAVAATKLATARKIAGVAFDGTSDISISNSNVGLGNVGNFAAVQQGGGAGMATNKVYIGWTGARVKIQVDATDMGEIYTTKFPPPAQDLSPYATSNWTYQNFATGSRRGGQQHKVGGDWIKAWEAPAGCYMTGLNTDEGNDGRKMGIYFRQQQIAVNGVWINTGD